MKIEGGLKAPLLVKISQKPNFFLWENAQLAV